MSRLCRLRTYKHGQDGQWAYEEITKLREQIAAQASEIESLRISYDAACMLVAQMHEAAMGEVIGPYHGVVEDVRTKVAAQAAVIEKLREALIAGWSLQCDFDDARRLADEALSIPTDSTQILDEVRRAEREKCAKVCDAKAAGARYIYQREELTELAAAIRAME